MAEAAQILHALAWPIVTLVVIWRFGGDLKTLIVKLGDRLDQAATIKLKLAGLGALELVGQVAKRSLVSGAGVTPAAGLAADVRAETSQQEFDRLLADYEAVNDADRSQRVAKRDQLANRLGTIGRKLPIVRSTLAAGPDAKIAVLATIIIAEPRKGDLTHLLTAAAHVEYKFSAYRLVLALLTFLSTFSPTSKSLPRAIEILDVIDKNVGTESDDDLQALIERARRVIEASAA